MNEGIEMLLGKTLKSIDQERNDHLRFVCEDGDIFEMFHYKDCCESVTIEDICGDLSNLIGTPIVMAEEVTNSDEPGKEYSESYTWTFYKLATAKGYVTIRWYGESNGYYSESVDFWLVTPKKH
ncbi:DUF7448 domain-containing protein [Acidaminobacter sp.]|uniref:DUF7448 domain-containing protein n=1 Tax=Acidaminobacter sp. TaxID=1872102 RepID=UPI0025BE8AFA|nr:hypothetical protein [Acidaminobacter sp.]